MPTQVKLDVNSQPQGLESLSLLEFEDKLVKGDLTADGVQYSAEVTSGLADAWTVAFTKTINSITQGYIFWLEAALTAAFIQLNATTTLTWKWQMRHTLTGTWVDLHPEVVEAANSITAYTARTRAGFPSIVANLQYVPLELRLYFKTSEANQGKAKAKNSSYVRICHMSRDTL